MYGKNAAKKGHTPTPSRTEVEIKVDSDKESNSTPTPAHKELHAFGESIKGLLSIKSHKKQPSRGDNNSKSPRGNNNTNTTRLGELSPEEEEIILQRRETERQLKTTKDKDNQNSSNLHPNPTPDPLHVNAKFHDPNSTQNKSAPQINPPNRLKPIPPRPMSKTPPVTPLRNLPNPPSNPDLLNSTSGSSTTSPTPVASHPKPPNPNQNHKPNQLPVTPPKPSTTPNASNPNSKPTLSSPVAASNAGKASGGESKKEGGYTDVCWECKEPLYAGQTLFEALSHQYHLDCFKCVKCEVVLNGKYVCIGMKQYCTKCGEEFSEMKCKKCEGIIENGTDYIKALNKATWHESCFNCGKCGVNLAVDKFFNKDGYPWCAKCTNA